MTRNVFLDIETIPTTDPEEMARIAAGVLEHNATLKKPHDDDEVKRLVDEAHRKTSLDGAFGEVVVIACAINDGAPTSWQRTTDGEAGLLKTFIDDLCSEVGNTFRIIGHNSNGFDRPFLRQRSLVHGVIMPPSIAAPLKPWDAVDVDTMLMWTQGQSGKFISLDKLARALGVGRKTQGIDGSKVWDFVCEGKIDEVARYCEHDVELTRAVWRRMSGR